MKCVNCGADVNEGDLFCTKCGTKIEQPVVEETIEQTAEQPVVEQPVVEQVVEQPVVEQVVPEQPMGQPMNQGAVPNMNQGAVPNMNHGAIPNMNQGTVPNMNQNTAPKKKKTGLVIGLVAAVAVVAVIAVLIIFVLPGMSFGGKEKEETNFFYVEDNELMIMDSKKIDEEATSLTDEFMSSDISWSDYGFLYSNIEMTSDGKRCYFPSEIDDDYNFDLCVASVKNGEAEVDKIDSNVSYFIMLDSDAILYMKSGKLYYYKNDDKTKIASDVANYFVSEDQKWVMWTENEEYDDETYEYTADLCMNTIDGSGDEVCIEEGVRDYIGANEDFTSIYLIKKDNLYKYDREGESEKILDDVNEVYGVDYDKNIFYYTEEKESDVNLLDYLDDPYAESDSSIEAEPVEPAYEDYEIEVYDEYWEEWYTEYDWDAYDQDWDAWYDEWDAWYSVYGEYGEATYRQAIRDEISEFDSEFYTQELYFFDGKESTLVTDNFEYFLEYPTVDKYILATKEYIVGDKISIDDLWDAYDLYYFAEDSANAKWGAIVFANGETEEVDEENIESVWSDDNMMYYSVYNQLDTEDSDWEDYYGPSIYTLYSFNLSAKDFGDTEELTDEMNAFEGIMNGVPYYICNADEDTEEGDLYAGTEEVASDVSLDTVGLLNDDDAVMFSRNIDWQEGSFTLVLFDGEEEEEIADDVCYFTAQNPNCIFYIADFDWDNYVGELYVYMNGDSESIADDVSMLYSYSKGVSGSYYGTW